MSYWWYKLIINKRIGKVNGIKYIACLTSYHLDEIVAYSDDTFHYPVIDILSTLAPTLIVMMF